MIDLATAGTAGLKLTNAMIAKEAMSRGWKAESYYLGSTHMRLTRPDGKVVEIHSSTPPTTSYAAASRCDDKYATHALLKECGFPVLDTRLDTDAEGAKRTASEFLNAGKKIVVKPLDSGHGNGVTVGVEHTADVDDAVAHAQAFSNKILVQEHVSDPVDVRITCIDYTPIAAVVRIPARVQGDGQHSIVELIDIVNSSDERGEGYQRALNRIPKDLAMKYLGGRAGDVPGSGEWVQVLGTANVGTGGETQDVTAELPAWLLQMAEGVAEAAELPVCGVDFLMAAFPKVDSTAEVLRPVIIELNKCPSLFLNEQPTHGQSRPVVKPYIDYLASL